MPEFGQFQIIEPLKLTDHGSVNVATRVGDGERRYALKVFPVPAEAPHGEAGEEGDDDEEVSPRWEAQYFLDHARVQQKLIAGGAAHWAAVHDLGMTPAGAYVVLDFCPRSVQTLLDQRAQPTIAELHAIATGILAGLTELKRLRGRSHGDLKPANVLLDGGPGSTTPATGDPTGLSGARILLTDPGSPAAAARGGEDGDLRSMGEMLRALVVGGATGAAATSAWDRLGTKRDAWREYIGGLLGAARGTPLGTLAAAQQALPRLAPSRPVPKPAKGLIVAAAAVVVIAGGIVAVLLALSASQWKQFQQARAQWLGGLIAATAVSPPPGWESDPQLHDVLDRISQAHLAESQTIDTSALPYSPGEYSWRRHAVAAQKAIADDLSPGHWQRLGHLTDLQAQFHSRRWNQPAEFLATLTAAATPPAPRLADGIDRVLRVSPAIDKTLPAIVAAWNQLTAATDVISAPHNPMLDAFADHLLTSAAASVHLGDAGLGESGDALASRLALAKQLDTATRDTSVDGARFASALSNRIDVNHVTDADVETYLHTVAQYAIQREAIGSATDALRKALADMSQTIASSRPRASEAAALSADRWKVEAQIQAFSASPFIAGDIADGTFRSRQQAIEAKIQALGKYSHPETAEEWIAGLTAPPVVSPTLLAAWGSKLQSLRGAAPALDKDRLSFLDAKTATARFRQSLIDLAGVFARPPTTLTPAFAEAAIARREALLKVGIKEIDPKTGQLNPEYAQGVREVWDDWLFRLEDLNADFPLRPKILTPANVPGSNQLHGDSGFWSDPVIQKLIAPDMARIHQLADVVSAGRPALVADLDSPTAEIALEAWRRLGEGGLAWPAGEGELEAEANADRHLRDLLTPIHDPVAAAGLADMRKQEPIRWRRYAESARSDQAIQTAVGLAPAFAVGAKQFDALSWPMDYDLWLAATRDAASAGDESALDADLPHLQAFGNSPGKPVAPGLATLGKADPHEPFFGQQLGDIYGLSLPGLAKPMEFRRVDTGGIRPFYLATSDVSFADFAGVIEGAKAWADARALPWNARPGQADPRRGPRVWEWTGPANSARLATPELWFTPDVANDFDPRFRSSEFNRNTLADAVGGNPTPAHPMQQISAESALWYAGLCGVRLPSSGEWLAAYSAFGKSIPIDRWNLRDQTWDEERQYLASVSAASGGPGGAAARWLDAEVFLPAGAHPPTGENAHARSDADGTLLFRPTGSGDQTFHNLVGNVFVYLCDATKAFGALTDKSPAGIHQFATAHADSLAVIGGSAMSAPQVPIDKPLALPRPDTCYADVGLRLAFTAPPRSRAERVRWALEDQPYIWPTATH
ncbi:MAG TPA: hypothetical protein VHY37_13920 [Tepidisphaeraceae bacterium]|jgi:hypothetical protein|nr:hypothetical protein [Tepidisphaeraceae bacterium]